MPLSLLFDHFDRLITRPGDLPRLNQTILQLAVQGKLVPQDPTDEPASELLKRIRAEKERLLLTGQLRRDEPLPPIGEDETPYELPKSWSWVRLGDISEYGNRESINGGGVSDDTWVLDLEDIEKATSRLLAKVQFKDRNFQSSKNVFREGDVLYGKLRPYLDKVIVADEDGLCSSEIVPIRGYPGIYPCYLKWALKRPDFLDYVNSRTYGTKMPRLGTKDAQMALIPLPPLAEQKRIVAKVENLLTQSQALAAELAAAEAEQSRLSRASLHHLLAAPTPADFAPRWHFVATHFDAVTPAPESVDELKQAILHLAVQGKLVEQDFNDAPTMDLIDRVGAERLALKPSNQDEKIILTELAKLRQELQKGSSTQVYITARCVCDFITKGTTPDTKEFSQNGDIPYLKVYNIVNNEIDFFYKPSYISKSIHETQLKRSKVFPGDVLMNIVGPPLGKVAIVPYDFEEWNTNQALAIFRPISLLDNRFLYYTLSCF